MILTRGKIVIIAIAIGIVATLAVFVLIANREGEGIRSQVTVTLKDVTMKGIDEEKNVMTIKVDFNVFNKASKTLTISKMDYELFANQKSLGQGIFSAESVPMSGRPPLFPSTNTTLPSDFRLNYSDSVKDVWNSLKSGNTANISWRANGTAEIESALSIVDVPFESKL